LREGYIREANFKSTIKTNKNDERENDLTIKENNKIIKGE